MRALKGTVKFYVGFKVPEMVKSGMEAQEQRKVAFEVKLAEYERQCGDPKYVPYPEEVGEGQERRMSAPVAPPYRTQAEIRKHVQKKRDDANEKIKDLAGGIYAQLNT